MKDRRESNMATFGGPVDIAPSSSHQQPSSLMMSASSPTLTKIRSKQQPKTKSPAKQHFGKPNFDALGKNVQNTYFSSVKWGGTPGGEVTDFKKTMKSIPAPLAHSHFHSYPKKLESSQSSPYLQKKIGQQQQQRGSPEKVVFPSITIETPGVARILHPSKSTGAGGDDASIMSIRDQADAIIGARGNIQTSLEITQSISPQTTFVPSVVDTRSSVLGGNQKNTARELVNIDKKNKEALRIFVDNAKSPGNSSERQWINKYAEDRNTFVSFARWAQITLTEAIQLTECGALPKNIIAALSAQLALETQPRLCNISFYIPKVLTNIFRSVFILTHEGVPTCSAAAQILEREEGIHEIFEVDGVFGLRQRLALFNSCPTYHDHVRWLWAKLKHELALRPALEVRIAARAKERQQEARAMEAACDRWAKMKIAAVFFEWVGEVELERKRHLLGKYFFFMTGIKQKDVYVAWKNWYRNEKADREKTKYRNAKEEAERLKAELERVRKHNSEMSREIAKLRKEIAILEQKLEEATNILLMDARQPPALEKVLKGLSKSLFKFRLILADQLEEQITETFREGPDTARLAPIYTWRTIKKGEVPVEKERTNVGEIEAETDCDEKDESEIKKWYPGQYVHKSEENTPSFWPFKTRPGMRSQRWANNLIRRDWMREDVVRGKLWRTHDDMKDCANWHSIMRSIKEFSPAVPEIPPLVIPERTCDNLFVDHPEVPKAMHFCNYLRTTGGIIPPEQRRASSRNVVEFDLPKSLGRYMDQKAITLLEPPPTPEQIAAQKERLRRLNARQAETGIVVHIMSKYMGMRVHVMDTGEQKSAALMAELFIKHFKTQDLWPGYRDTCTEKYEKVFVEGWNRIIANVEFVLANADASDWFKIGEIRKVPMWISEYIAHDKLKKYASDTADRDKHARKVANSIIKDYRDCLADRMNYRQHIKDLLRHTWQSLCTTILSRRLRTEEDIDDGTFTTVEKVQFAMEFKRLGILSEEVRDEQCAEMKKYLKLRIRDLKRIFQFYAAAGDGGPATTMDHGEFWKFVKDCKMQKDRKKMPSVRVDLIFQCCNLDYSVEGKDRMATDDGELEPPEFVEGLARLAVYKYTQNTPAERLNKLLKEDVLPNACSVDTDVFRERIAGDRVKDVFAKHKFNLKKIYREFAADDDTGDAAMANDTMNSNELVSFCRDFKFIGPLISERSIKVLFAYVQQDEEALDDDENDDVGDSEMVFSEFAESQAALGCQMRPDPYNVVEMRIDQFLCQEVIPKALDMLRFRGKGLRKLEKPEGATGE